MNDLRLNNSEIQLLLELTKNDFLEIIWDLNAFYFNTYSKTYKLECLEAKPVGSDYEYNEIFYCSFSLLKKRIKFKENDPDFWYKNISTYCKIKKIETVTVTELFPENKVISFQDIVNNENGLNKSTIGLIIETDQGFLPAFLLPSNYGFSWQPKYEFYSKMEIDVLVADNIGKCEIRNIT